MGSGDTAGFVADLRWSDVPERVRARVTALVRDFVAVSLAGRAAPTARIAADYAAAQHAGDEATALFDCRRVAATGAAWANGVLANALDYDDGHRLVKGHPGANVIPAALAVGEAVGAPPEEVLAAVTVGYEVALRAGVELHARSGEYHASGAWGALGAATAAARLLDLDRQRTHHALGLAAYHAPIAPIMASVAQPAMTKDACGWGAFLGTSAALLAADGFTAVPGAFLERADSRSSDYGQRWHVEDVYVKRYPCCRWSQPAVEAARALRKRHCLEAARIARVEVRTFAAATALARGLPATTEEAQYSLAWPLAVTLVHGDFGVEHVLEPAFDDEQAQRLIDLVEVEADPDLEAAFPATTLAVVVIETTEGDRHRSAVARPPGEADDPGWEAVIEDKFERFAGDRPAVLDRLIERCHADHPL